MSALALMRRSNHRLATIVDWLFTKEWITVGEAQKLGDVTYPTAQSDLETLVELGIPQQVKKARPAIFIAPAVWNLSDRK